MIDIDFYVEVAEKGGVAGLGLGSSPDEWARRLGDDYVDDIRRSRMRRDYGLIEIAFSRSEAAWESTGIYIQVHRLAWSEQDMVPTVLQDSYGAFSDHVPYQQVMQRLRAHECLIQPLPEEPGGEYSLFWVADSATLIQVLADPAGTHGPGPQTGDLWSIIHSTDALAWKDSIDVQK